jgi:hypothetical protein
MGHKQVERVANDGVRWQAVVSLVKKDRVRLLWDCQGGGSSHCMLKIV